jgi:hypothetical protein
MVVCVDDECINPTKNELANSCMSIHYWQMITTQPHDLVPNPLNASYIGIYDYYSYIDDGRAHSLPVV